MVTWDRVTPGDVARAIEQFATRRRLRSGDFEGGKTGAVKVLRELGFTVRKKLRRR